MSLFIRKPLSQLITQADDSEKSLKRTLGPMSLVALGIGAIIGAGLFIRTAAAAGGHAGSAVRSGGSHARTKSTSPGRSLSSEKLQVFPLRYDEVATLTGKAGTCANAGSAVSTRINPI